MIAKYVDPRGRTVQIGDLGLHEKLSLPRFDIEVVEQGEVVEHFTIAGHYVLQQEIIRRRWTVAA